MKENENEPVLGEVILTRKQEEEHFDYLLSQEEEAQGDYHSLPALARHIDTVLWCNGLVTEEETAEVVYGLRCLASWMERDGASEAPG